MEIVNVTITVQDIESAARFYRETLGLPVIQNHREVVVRIGSSQLTLRPGGHFEGAHHLAFGIPPDDFPLARRWLAGVVEPIKVGDTEVIDAPEGWDAQSVYFHGPENIILELIARQADSNLPGSTGGEPQLIAISEVGIGVPDVPAAVQQAVEDLGVSPFSAQGQRFAPVGDHQGLLILVEAGRTWFPTRNLRPARGPMTVLINTIPPKEGDAGGAPTHVLTYESTQTPPISIDAIA
ncbi:VOC family protein [Arthrobacter castelli]|uniref:VOC family protein n=1 Tax=Arthrobacter castelli TaxID=271431 RepID=UPI0004262E5D|nr:VOC family protein [Arthrobacter castelli]